MMLKGRRGPLAALALTGALAVGATPAQAEDRKTVAEAELVLLCDESVQSCRTARAAFESARTEAHSRLAEWLERYGDLDGLMAELQAVAAELGLGKDELAGLLAGFGLPGHTSVMDQVEGALTGWGLLGGRGGIDSRADLKSMLGSLTGADTPPIPAGRLGGAVAQGNGGGGSYDWVNGLTWLVSDEDGSSMLGFETSGGDIVGVDIGGALAPGPGGQTQVEFEPETIVGGSDDDPEPAPEPTPDAGTPDGGTPEPTPEPAEPEPAEPDPGTPDGGTPDSGSGGPDDVDGLGSGDDGDDGAGTALAHPVNCADGMFDCYELGPAPERIPGDGVTDPSPTPTTPPRSPQARCACPAAASRTRRAMTSGSPAAPWARPPTTAACGRTPSRCPDQKRPDRAGAQRTAPGPVPSPGRASERS